MPFRLADTFDQLRRTPAVLDALLRGADAPCGVRTEGPDTWSVFDVVGHLVHGEETDWVPRARLILQHGEAAPFTPFDRFAQFERFAGVPLDDLLDRFAALRRQNLAEAEGWRLTDADLDRRGTHPAFGPVTLRQLLATWATHDLNHLAQIARVLARAATDDVGPWRAYLGILPR